MDYSEGEQQSEFNSSLEALKRVAIIKREMHNARITHSYKLQCELLKSYYFELACVLKKDEKTTQSEKYTEMKKIFDFIRAETSKKTGEIPKSMIDQMEDWELELRELDQKHNMNILMQKDARFALARR